MRRSPALSALAVAVVAACSRAPTPTPDTPPSAAVHVAPAPSPALAPASAPASAAASAPAAASATATAAASAPTPPTADAAPTPKVKVVNIGMHIGGGPNDDATKEPIRASVEPHFDAFRRCWGVLADPAAKGDFGLDLHIGKDGGKASVDHPRTALKGKAFTDCVVGVFEAIDFRKPKTGMTTVSYSLRFTP